MMPNRSHERRRGRIAGVCERDIDLLLLEEFLASPACRDRGGLSSILLVLAAPERYIGDRDEHGFDAVVTYEAIREWFVGCEDLGARGLYKADLLESAIDKGVLGYTPVADEPVSEFWARYWELVMAEHPQLEMRPPGNRAARAGFIRFFPRAIAARRDLRLRHKLQHQAVDLEFADAGNRAGELHTALAASLEPGMSIVKTGKCVFRPIVISRFGST